VLLATNPLRKNTNNASFAKMFAGIYADMSQSEKELYAKVVTQMKENPI